MGKNSSHVKIATFWSVGYNVDLVVQMVLTCLLGKIWDRAWFYSVHL